MAAIATAYGPENLAFDPSPFVDPDSCACPASVVTTVAGEIARIRWFPVSATYTLPLEDEAIPRGRENNAFVP